MSCARYVYVVPSAGCIFQYNLLHVIFPYTRIFFFLSLRLFPKPPFCSFRSIDGVLIFPHEHHFTHSLCVPNARCLIFDFVFSSSSFTNIFLWVQFSPTNFFCLCLCEAVFLGLCVCVLVLAYKFILKQIFDWSIRMHRHKVSSTEEKLTISVYVIWILDIYIFFSMRNTNQWRIMLKLQDINYHFWMNIEK